MNFILTVFGFILAAITYVLVPNAYTLIAFVICSCCLILNYGIEYWTKSK